MYGPNGTGQIRVIFYEGDANTGMNAITGTGGNTLGDWTAGITYPIVNESPLQLSLSVYAPLGFPTVNIIRPADREIVADVYNQNLEGMIDAINYYPSKQCCLKACLNFVLQVFVPEEQNQD